MNGLSVATAAHSGRRLGAWGFEGESYPPSAQLRAWLEARLGPSAPFAAFDLERIRVCEPRPLPALPGSLSRDPVDRIAHARGQGLTDLLRLRSATIPRLPDAVARPHDDAEVEALLRACATAGIQVIPWGGGTSVTGGVNVMPGVVPVVTLDLEDLAGLQAFDPTSGLATFGAGTMGPAIESALRQRRCTMGHFPQSWELSTLGGWLATRASGQESLGYGDIQNLAAGLELIAPAGRLTLAAYPSSAAGPDLRQLVMGSEGRLGVITRATVRVRALPDKVEVVGTLLPTWREGLEAARELLQGGVPLSLLRLSDEPETEVAMAVGLSGHRWAAPLVRTGLRLRGITRSGCLMLCGAAGTEGHVCEAHAQAHAVLRRHGGVSLGTHPGHRWMADRFRHPYLRDALLDLGIATDTLETAAPWSRLPELTDVVRRAFASALQAQGEATAVLCHVSHPYRDGASLYFTFFFRCPSDPEHALDRWATLKRAATTAIVSAGGTLSHHHGVGSWHAPWFKQEVGETGLRLLRMAAAVLDPGGILNPHVLLDPTDLLTV